MATQMLVSIDDGVTFVAMDTLQIIYKSSEEGDLEEDQSEREDLHLIFNGEGMTIDVVGQESDEVKVTSYMEVQDIQAIAESD